MKWLDFNSIFHIANTLSTWNARTFGFVIDFACNLWETHMVYDK